MSATVTVSPLPLIADPADLLKDAIASLDLPADWVGIRATREESVSRSQRDGKPERPLLQLFHSMEKSD